MKFVRKLSKTLQIEAKTGDVLYDLNRKLGTHYLDLNGLTSFWTESLWALGYRYKSLLNNVNNSNTTKNNTGRLHKCHHRLAQKSNAIAAVCHQHGQRKSFPRPLLTRTRSSAIAEGPRDASCQLKSCQLPRNSTVTTCTTSPEPSISCR